MNHSYYEKKLDMVRGQKTMLLERKKKNAKQLKEMQEQVIAVEKAQIFLQQVAKDTQEQLKYRISDIVNKALDTCYPDEYVFNTDFNIKRGKTEAELYFTKNGAKINPMKSSGGGVVDLASFALRVVAWVLGHSDNVLVLDEPLKWLQPKELQVKGYQIIKELSEKLGIQFIIISNSVNNEDISMIADRMFFVTKDRKTGISRIEVRE